MRLKLFAAAAAVAGLTAFSAFAQEGEGQYGKDLRRVIEAAAAGDCPGDLMGNELLTACLQQMPQMAAGLSSLGAIQSIVLQSAEDTSDGLIETYVVTFESGMSLTWGIGHVKDGKYSSVYARS